MKRVLPFVIAFFILLGLSACDSNEPNQEEEGLLTWQEQYDLGVRYLSEGNYEEAIIAFTAAIEIDPKQAPAYVGRGQAYILSGESEENLIVAQADYETAIKLDETYADAWLGLADIYIRLGNYERAKELLQEALKKTENAQTITEKLAEMESGTFSDSEGKTRQVSNYDKDGNLKFYIVYTYDAEGRFATAASYDERDQQTGYVNYVYDNEGRLLTGASGLAYTGAICAIDYEYDEEGRVIKETYHEPSGPVYAYQYDNSGNLIKTEVYNISGEYRGYTTCLYNDEEKLVRTDYFLSDGTLVNYALFEYNKNGQVEKYSQFECKDGEAELISCFLYRYDEKGWQIGYDIYDEAGNKIGSEVNVS